MRMRGILVAVACAVVVGGCGNGFGWDGYIDCSCEITCPTRMDVIYHETYDGSTSPDEAERLVFEACQRNKEYYCYEPVPEDCFCSCNRESP